MEAGKIVLGLLLFSAVTFAGVIGPGEYWYGNTELRDEIGYETELIINGGGAEMIRAYDTSSIVINSTSSPIDTTSGSGVGWIMLSDDSILVFKDGMMAGVDLYDNATAVLSGGSINHIYSFQDVGWWYGEPVDQHIEMIVKTHVHNVSTNLLTGTWADDSAFSIQLHNQTSYDDAIDNIKFAIVPEPATLLLFGLGGLILRKKTLGTQN